MVLGVSAFDSFDDVSLSESLGAASFLPGIFDRSCNVFVFLMFLLSYDDTLTILSGVEYRLLNRHTGALDIILFVSFSGIIFRASASDSVSISVIFAYNGQFGRLITTFTFIGGGCVAVFSVLSDSTTAICEVRPFPSKLFSSCIISSCDFICR